MNDFEEAFNDFFEIPKPMEISPQIAVRRIEAPDLPFFDNKERYEFLKEKLATAKSVGGTFFSDTVREMMDFQLDLISQESLRLFSECVSFERIIAPFGIKNLKKMLYNEVQNAKLFEWLFCSFNKAYLSQELTIGVGNNDHGMKEYQFNTYSRSVNIANLRNTISELTTLSKEGNFGQLWQTKINKYEDLLYIKTIKNPWSENSNLKDYSKHEFFIGYKLNTLRPFIPNFMYVYSLFTCGYPEKGVPCYYDETAFPLGVQVNYLLIEAIKNAIPIKKIFQLNSNAGLLGLKLQLMSIYFQIVLALGIAYEKFDFTHYDLHTENVILEPIKDSKVVLIKYIVEGQTYYVKTSYIARIIDYGLSHVKHDDMDFGLAPLDGTGNVRAYRSMPLHDIYEFGGFLLFDILAIGNYDLMLSMRSIMDRFHNFQKLDSQEEWIDRLTKERGQMFMRKEEPDQKLETPTLYTDHIAYIIKENPELLGTVIFPDTRPMNIPLLDCQKECTFDIDAKVTQSEGDLKMNKYQGKRERDRS